MKETKSKQEQVDSTLKISKEMKDKIRYYLNEYPNREWSGPAWYKITKTDKETNIPSKVVLQYFVGMDLGDYSATEVDGEDLSDLLFKLKDDKRIKDCYLGLIHSHHTMGAFFSGTDVDTANEQATFKQLFFSTVVASEGNQVSFGFSYLDQFSIPRFLEGEYAPSKPKIKVLSEWKEEVDNLNKQEVKSGTITYGNYRGYGGYNGVHNFNNNNQLSLVNNNSYIESINTIRNDKNDLTHAQQWEKVNQAIESFEMDNNWDNFVNDIEKIDKALNPSELLLKRYT